jgi:hypothetical protein
MSAKGSTATKQKPIQKQTFSQDQKNKIVEKLITARIGLLLRHPS